MSIRRYQISLIMMCLLPYSGGCVSIGPADHKRQEIVYEEGKVQKFSYLGDMYGTNQENGSKDFLEVVDMLQKIDSSVFQGLPIKKKSQTHKVKKYTGLIQNLSRFDISIPSDNSDAVIIVPALSWREYVAWEPNVKLFGFVDAKQVYFESLKVQPKKFEYMGNFYDFIAKIQPQS